MIVFISSRNLQINTVIIKDCFYIPQQQCTIPLSICNEILPTRDEHEHSKTIHMFLLTVNNKGFPDAKIPHITH